MGKWQKIDPADIKVGDLVRMVDAYSMFQISGKTSPSKIGICVGGIDFTEAPECRTWYIRKAKPAKPHGDTSEGRTAKHWHARYLKQLQHTERLQEANRGRRQRMKLLKKEAEDARAQVQGWESRYAVLAASFTESDYHSAETQAQLDDAMLTIEDQRTELKNLRQVLADEQNSTPRTRPDEPPYGVLFRVDRSGIDYCRAATAAYVPVHGELRWRWDQITKPGDTITLLELTEKGDKKDGGV